MKISDELNKVVGYAREEAMRTGYYGIAVEHLLLGILRHRDEESCRALASTGMSLEDLKSSLDEAISRGWSIPFAEMDCISLTREAQNVLSLAVVEAQKCGASQTEVIHLLRAISHSTSPFCQNYFSRHRLDTPAALKKPASPSMETESHGVDPQPHSFIYTWASTKQSECS